MKKIKWWVLSSGELQIEQGNKTMIFSPNGELESMTETSETQITRIPKPIRI